MEGVLFCVLCFFFSLFPLHGTLAMLPPDSMKKKTILLRTCAQTRKKNPKSRLFRIVKSPSGSLEYDPVGNAPGRGMYVEKTKESIELLFSPGRKGLIGKLLRSPFSDDERTRLRNSLLSAVEEGRKPNAS